MLNDFEWKNKHLETRSQSINKKNTSRRAYDDTGNDVKGTVPPYSKYTKLTVVLVYALGAHFTTAVATLIIHDRSLDLKKYPTLPDIILDIVHFGMILPLGLIKHVKSLFCFLPWLISLDLYFTNTGNF